MKPPKGLTFPEVKLIPEMIKKSRWISPSNVTAVIIYVFKILSSLFSFSCKIFFDVVLAVLGSTYISSNKELNLFGSYF